jgi:hypothetical protein
MRSDALWYSDHSSSAPAPVMPSTRSEKENYNCFLDIMNVVVWDGFRKIFKQEWDKQYGAYLVIN